VPSLQSQPSERLGHVPDGEKSPALGYLVFFLGLVMVAYGITALWFGMRGVMEVGGYCAEGGPYVIEQHCPDGAEVLLFTGIPVGVIGLFVAMAGGAMAAKGAAGLLLLGWPAVFCSLGWNFIEYAIDPPAGMGSTGGWWVCGVIFALMGLPALGGIPMLVKAIRPDRRNAVLAVFLTACAAGIALGIRVDSLVG